MPAAALITDLFFVAKVKGTADALGVPLVVVRDLAGLTREAQAGAEPVIVDLNAAGVDPLAAIRACRALPRPPRVIAYLSHVQRELAESARAAGADLVLPRSQFSRDLPAILTGEAEGAD
ncbi:MAG: response regulator transcription factor [Phycisphaerae bacterium]|jgi:DNA-binding NarL/FixJ family response regulator